MNLLKLDQEKCIVCAQCAAVCPSGFVEMSDQGPQDAAGQTCLACGHCVAVCPTAALDHVQAPLAKQQPIGPLPVFDADTAARFLRSRRSIRRFKSQPVPRDAVVRLLDIARLAPSASNSQGIAYHVIDKAAVLQEITARCVDWMETLNQPGKVQAAFYAKRVADFRKNGYDFILRDAPCLVIAHAPQASADRARDTSRFALAYAELYAPSLGLGSCWAGFFESCAGSGYQPLREILGLPQDTVVTGAVMLGVPQYHYQRLVDRNPLQLSWHRAE